MELFKTSSDNLLYFSLGAATMSQRHRNSTNRSPQGLGDTCTRCSSPGASGPRLLLISEHPALELPGGKGEGNSLDKPSCLRPH